MYRRYEHHTYMKRRMNDVKQCAATLTADAHTPGDGTPTLCFIDGEREVDPCVLIYL